MTEWRRVGAYEWRDPLAALEHTSSPEFQKAVQHEDAHWKKALQPHKSAIQKWKSLFQKYQSTAYPETLEYAYIRCKWQDRLVHLQPGAAGYTYNVWITDAANTVLWSQKDLTAIEWDSNSPYMCTLHDIGNGAERLQLSVYKWTTKPVLQWKQDPVGPTVAIQNGYLYYLCVENALRYHELWSADLKTGLKPHRLYHEPDKRVQLAIHKKDSMLFLHAANALFQKIAKVTTKGLQWTALQKSTIVPLNRSWYATNSTLQKFRSTEKHPFPSGQFLQDAQPGPDNSLFLTTVQNGQTTLWYISDPSPTKSWIPLLKPEGLSDIEIVPFPTEHPTFVLKRPDTPLTIFEFRAPLGIAVLQTLQFPEPLKLQTLKTDLAGPNKVPYTVITAVTNPHPQKLLVIGYGAYGMSAQRQYPIRWLPYLDQGYALAIACPRGGREKGDAWYDGARTALRKHHTFEDTAAVIRAVQTCLSVPPVRTLFFGRSAGGWLAARIAQDYGHLVAAVYAEVPYVDVLRTTTNPDLPLTQLEYDEFGDPLHRPAELEALKRLSPVDTVPPCSRCPRVVIRTGVNDMQVLPYEALKWAIRLREKGWRQVFVGIDHDGGHFAAATAMNEQRAQDAALLDAATKSRAATRRSHRIGRLTRRR